MLTSEMTLAKKSQKKINGKFYHEGKKNSSLKLLILREDNDMHYICRS